LKEKINSANASDLKAAIEEYNQQWHAISQKIYQQASAAGQQTPGPEAQGAPNTGNTGNGQTVDADYEVVDDDKNK